MGRNPEFLNEKQIAVLQWVKAGCPAEVYTDGFAHRIIAGALETRGLVRIRGQGATWRAETTDSGLSWASPVPPPVAVQPVDVLVQRVLESSGRLRLANGELTSEVRRLVERSAESSVRPRGKALGLAIDGSFPNQIQLIVFVDYFDDLVTPKPVPAVQRVSKPHPAITAYMNDPDWAFVSKQHIPRAVRLLQSIAEEAARRDIEVVPPERPTDLRHRGGRWPHKPTEVFSLVMDGQAFSVTIEELSSPGGGKLPYSHDHLKHPHWLNMRHWRFVSSGRLQICCAGAYRDERWTALETKLPEVFRGMEIYALKAAQRERATAAREAKLRETQETARRIALKRYEEHTRLNRFLEMSDQADALSRHRAFLAQARVQIRDYGVEASTSIGMQLSQIEKLLDETDPLARLSELIAPLAEPTAGDLRPFL